jgi:arginase
MFLSSPIGVIGVPTSAGAFAPGQEQAPRALRDAGLLDLLVSSGAEVRDHGDREIWRWRPDRRHPRAQNVGPVVEIVADTARRVGDSVRAGETTLVLGGDCTVGVGAVAGQMTAGEPVGLVYFDAHADLNVPGSVREGALDWMGLAHMLGEQETVPELREVGPGTPLLESEQVLLFGWDADQATAFERETIERRRIPVVPAAEVAEDPLAAGDQARKLVQDRCDRLLVHFDVDVIDFTDVPLSENWGRNVGIAYEDAITSLGALIASERFVGLTITELNPDHTEQGANSLARFAGDVARCLSRSSPSED